MREKEKRWRGRKVKKSHSFGKCARRILEVTASKISIFNAFIKLLIFTKSGSPFLFGCSVTLPGQALLRVRGRAMDLRAGLDGEDAGNTCRIVKSSLVHFLLT